MPLQRRVCSTKNTYLVFAHENYPFIVTGAQCANTGYVPKMSHTVYLHRN